jgi:predicted enzyme related to lactoylglutathione lyase
MKILRTLTRVCVNDLDDTVRFYERLTGNPAALRFCLPAAGLELSQVGDLLIIAGPDAAIVPFRPTTATFLVDSVDEYHRFLRSNGATIIRPPQQVPTGINMTVRHPDGLIVEYVEHTNDAGVPIPG